jgi:hypothetical protein
VFESIFCFRKVYFKFKFSFNFGVSCIIVHVTWRTRVREDTVPLLCQRVLCYWMILSLNNRLDSLTEFVLNRVKEERNVLRTVRRREANSVGHILHRNCLLEHITEGKIEERSDGETRKKT